MAGKNIITINSNIDVEVGYFSSKFVKFSHRTKHSLVSVTLSETCWRFVCDNIGLIRQSLQNGSEIELNMTVTKSLKVINREGQGYVTLCELFWPNQEPPLKLITLSKPEWDLVEAAFPLVQDKLSQVVLFSTDGIKWYLLREQALCGHGTAGDVYVSKLAPTMCNNTLVLQLCAYLIQCKIKSLSRKNCKACINPKVPIPMHMFYGCMSSWDDLVDHYYNQAFYAIKPFDAIAVLNKRMDWKIEAVHGSIDRKRLRAMTVRVNSAKFCDSCKEVGDSYWSLYQFLELEQAGET